MAWIRPLFWCFRVSIACCLRQPSISKWKNLSRTIPRNHDLIRRGIGPSIMVSVWLVMASPAQAQFLNRVNLDRVNSQLAGHVVDYTNNHGSDRRIFSPILGQPRDLYVYLPPGYDPGRAYPLVLFFHMADVDEHYFVGSKLLNIVDNLIVCGAFPPAVIVGPDGMYGGRNRLNARHSLYVNGCGGRYEDHVLQEVVPFLMANYSIRPEREAHAIVGASAGGYGAMSIAIEHRDFFGAVATLAGPLNLRYSNEDGKYFENFDPLTYRWKTRYNPNEVIGISYFGLLRLRAKRFMGPVFGEGDAVAARIAQTNPADKLFATDLQPGQLDIYISFGSRDNFNFDAQGESFQSLAAGKGITVTMVSDPGATHSLRYLRANLAPAFIWLGQHILPPTPDPRPVPTVTATAMDQ
jgi:S-formylglutathione hydrolase FrmB